MGNDTPSKVRMELATKGKMLVLYQDYHGIITSEDGSHSIEVQAFMSEAGIIFLNLEDSLNEEEEEALLAKGLIEAALIQKDILERAAVEDIA